MLPPLELSDGWSVLVSSVVWFVTSFLVGWRAVHWSRERLEMTGPFTTLRDWEHGGQSWQRLLRVRRWKGRLPEAGAFFDRGTSMRALGSRETSSIREFRRSTVRAERVHWLIFASTPVHLLWCRAPVALGMVGFGVVFNAPCIIVQRYNRGGLERVLARRAAREVDRPVMSNPDLADEARSPVANPDMGSDPGSTSDSNPPSTPLDPS